MFGDEFFDEVKQRLMHGVGRGHWWTQPGECLMSGADTLDSSNGVMILGLNPGGGNHGSELPPLRDQIREFRENRGGPFSAYVDQCWHYTRPGFQGWPQQTCRRCEATGDGATVNQVSHQKRVSEVVTKLGLDLRQTVALNAVWVQTQDAKALRQKAADSADHLGLLGRPTVSDLFEHVYFPILRVLIAGAGIRHVLCLGNGRRDSSFALLADAYGKRDPAVHKAVQREWCHSYRHGRSFVTADLRVFGVPHPSRCLLSNEGVTALGEWYESRQPAIR